jgi:hypothetical protein
MSAQAAFENSREPGPDRRDHRKHRRVFGKAVVEIIREKDNRRLAISGDLVDISVGGIKLTSCEEFTSGERVSVRLRNDIQRFQKHLHGVIRWSRATGEGTHQVGIGLNAWLHPCDMQILTQCGFRVPDGQKIWI